MTPKAVFFDLDDTLIEFDGRKDEAWRAAIAEFARGTHGLPPQQTLAETFYEIRARYWNDRETVEADREKGINTRAAVLTRFLEEFGLYGETAVARLLELFAAHMKRLARLFSDARKALEALRARGIGLIMITNGNSETQRWKINRFGLDAYFDHILVSGELGFSKPDPRIFARALELAGCAPGEAWMVGDNKINDVQGAKSLGIRTALRRREQFGYQLPSAEPDATVDDLSELMEIWFPL